MPLMDYLYYLVGKIPEHERLLNEKVDQLQKKIKDIFESLEIKYDIYMYPNKPGSIFHLPCLVIDIKNNDFTTQITQIQHIINSNLSPLKKYIVQLDHGNPKNDIYHYLPPSKQIDLLTLDEHFIIRVWEHSFTTHFISLY